VLDPFAGSGTVLLAAERSGVDSIGIEAHPFVARVAKVKLAWREDVARFRKLAKKIVEKARQNGGTAAGYPPLIGRCFPPSSLRRLDALRAAWAAQRWRAGKRIELARVDGNPAALFAGRYGAMAIRTADDA
jgi:hypothetical protein